MSKTYRKFQRRLPRPVDGLPPWPRGRHILHGDIIIANHTSYVDVLYFYFRFNPIFTEYVSCEKSQCKIRPITWWEAFLRCGTADMDGKKTSQRDRLTSLGSLSSEAKKLRSGPIVLFPERTTSNGRGILRLYLNPIDQALISNVHIVTIR